MISTLATYKYLTFRDMIHEKFVLDKNSKIMKFCILDKKEIPIS